MDKGTLAINGGPKAIEGFESKGQPKIGNEEFLEMADTWGYSQETIDEIRKVIDKEDLDGGPYLVGYKPESKMFQIETEAAELFNVKHILPVTSGTAALHCAYVAADICYGDEVIVPGYTFMATAMAAVVAGGIPVWCEIDESMTIDPSDVEKRITPRTKAIAPVHMSGYVCDMDAVMDVAKRHNLMVIEDCAQACGASLHGRRIGTIGHLGCFSISSYKPTGGGEGGLVMTNDDKLYWRARQWSEAGGLWRPDRFALPRWEGELFCGLNYRMSELAATVNLVQLRKMDVMIARKRTNKRRIIAALPVYRELQPQVIHDLDGEHGDKIGFFTETAAEAERLVSALQAEGVGCGTRGRSDRRDWHIYKYVSAIMEKMPATSDACPWRDPRTGEEAPVEYSPDMCPRTLDLLSRHVTVGVNQWWTERDCQQVAAAMTKVFDAFYTRDSKSENLRDRLIG
jgi:8-amino-3,8-dideoxy-alpha-D-manno-octulosonate transaminase